MPPACYLYLLDSFFFFFLIQKVRNQISGRISPAAFIWDGPFKSTALPHRMQWMAEQPFVLDPPKQVFPHLQQVSNQIPYLSATAARNISSG